MSSPIQLIAQGHKEQNWELVAEAYKLLTGVDLNIVNNLEEFNKPLEKQKKKPGRPPKLKKEKKTQPSVPVESKENAEEEVEEVKTSKRMYSTRQSFEVKKRPNLFNPDKFKNDKEVVRAGKLDRIVSDISPRSPRERDEVKKVKIKCSKCKENYWLYPSQILLVDGESQFICNDCTCR